MAKITIVRQNPGNSQMLQVEEPSEGLYKPIIVSVVTDMTNMWGPMHTITLRVPDGPMAGKVCTARVTAPVPDEWFADQGKTRPMDDKGNVKNHAWVELNFNRFMDSIGCTDWGTKEEIEVNGVTQTIYTLEYDTDSWIGRAPPLHYTPYNPKAEENDRYPVTTFLTQEEYAKVEGGDIQLRKRATAQSTNQIERRGGGSADDALADLAKA